ncbi:MAG: CBS domain-containing protein [Elusimicrobiota bacterium]
MKAKNIMRKQVITVETWLTLKELAKLFEEKQITGAPVVDETGAVVGVVSQTDLVRNRGEASGGVPVYHRELEEPTRSVGIHYEELEESRVERIMTPGAIAVGEETPVEELAKIMVERHIHRLLVTKNNRLTGIVTSMDLLRALVTLAKKRPARAAQARH